MIKVDSIQIRNIELGAGQPKICIPVVGKTPKEVLTQLETVMDAEPDCIELRVDWLTCWRDVQGMKELLLQVRERIDDVPLLFTFRTAKEGGEQDIAPEEYIALCQMACDSGCIDLVDVEAYYGEGMLRKMCKIAHERQVYVVASNHDFHNTPEEKELLNRLQYMDEQGADISKLAMMPTRERDVLRLLSATLSYYESGGRKPVITMSMQDMGKITRLAGGVVGSAMTFAVAAKASAPGQIAVDKVRETFSILY